MVSWRTVWRNLNWAIVRMFCREIWSCKNGITNFANISILTITNSGARCAFRRVVRKIRATNAFDLAKGTVWTLETIFQAEITVITDSQTTLKTLQGYKINSRGVNNVDSLEKLATILQAEITVITDTQTALKTVQGNKLNSRAVKMWIHCVNITKTPFFGWKHPEATDRGPLSKKCWDVLLIEPKSIFGTAYASAKVL